MEDTKKLSVRECSSEKDCNNLTEIQQRIKSTMKNKHKNTITQTHDSYQKFHTHTNTTMRKNSTYF